MTNLRGPTFRDLFPGVSEYHNGKPTPEFGHYLSACSHACARADAQQARAFDAAPEVEEDIAEGMDGLRELAHDWRDQADGSADFIEAEPQSDPQLYDPSGHHRAAMNKYNRLTRLQSRASAQRIRARDHAAMSDLEQMECDAAAHCGAWMGRI